MIPPQSRLLDDGTAEPRLHLQHGPIDLIIGVDDPSRSAAEVSVLRLRAFSAAEARFQTVLTEVVSELPQLRAAARPDGPLPSGSIARRMAVAVQPFAEHHFITPMAAVAGALADEILAAMLAAFGPGELPGRAYVNNGGDIALYLDGQTEFRIRMAQETGTPLGDFAIRSSSPSRGVATSGRGGRSLSMGVADSVTVVAADAAAADAAATIIGNAVDLPGHPGIVRARAIDVVDDSDLGERPVVVDCGILSEAEVDRALAAGAAMAECLMAAGLVHRAALFLRQRGRVVAPSQPDTTGIAR